MRSSAFITLVAVLVAVVAALSVDAYTYRVYRGNADCISSGSGNSVTYYFGSINRCLESNSTTTNQYIYSKITKCNATSGLYYSSYYGNNKGCTGTPTTSTGEIGKCYEFTPSTTPRSSYRVTCSAGSVAFAAVLAIIAIVGLLF